MKTATLLLISIMFIPQTAWGNPQLRGRQSVNNRLTGTWRLNPSQSDNPRDVINRATRNMDTANQQRVEENLARRLEAPDTLAIERRGRAITMASSKAPQVSFAADGREVSETTRNGRQRRTRATLSGDVLSIRTTGDRGNDFEVTIEPINGGRSLRVTRRLTTDRLNQTVVSQSIYDRTSDVAQLDVYGGDSYNTDPGRDTEPIRDRRRGDFLIPDGTQLRAALDQELRTQDVRENERFTMTVREPNRYRGAVIEGRVLRSERSGRVTGRAGFDLAFERLRMTDGRTYEFAGTIDSVRLPNGENIRVDQEGNVEEDDSQTGKTVGRSAIGGAIGAIIGAIAGGGKGAAIGAIVGAGAGAGSVFIQGRDDLTLSPGTEFVVRASGPR